LTDIILHDLYQYEYPCLLISLTVYSMTFSWDSDRRDSSKESSSFIGMQLNNTHFQSYNVFVVIQNDFSDY
jgi:hypothetical protein